MNHKRANVRMKTETQAVRVIQPAWWVDEAVAIEIRSIPVQERNEGNACNAAVARASKRAHAPRFPRREMVLRKELIC
jgi:hypothetical protein